jgi:tryptophan synthase alpha chain
MSRIADTFDELSKSKEGAYIPYICAGDPSREFSLELMMELSEAGADIFEMGIPFSDPIADGPVVQGAMQRSLSGGFAVADVFGIISEARSKGVEQPIVVMTYYNSILQAGVERFCRELQKSGGDGILVVDLLPEDSGELDVAANKQGLDIIRLVAPSTLEDRVSMIASKATGFIYAVSVAGTTGARRELPKSAFELLRRIRSATRMPVALGFGISDPGSVRAAMKAGASAVVEGSKLISIYAENLSDEVEGLSEVNKHASEMKRATKSE